MPSSNLVQRVAARALTKTAGPYPIKKAYSTLDLDGGGLTLRYEFPSQSIKQPFVERLFKDLQDDANKIAKAYPQFHREATRLVPSVVPSGDAILQVVEGNLTLTEYLQVQVTGGPHYGHFDEKALASFLRETAGFTLSR